jgi:hypothetical protein
MADADGIRRRTWRYGVVEHSESTNVLTGWMRSVEAAQRKAEELAAAYPRACVAVSPPTAVEERWAAEQTERDKFDVEYWQVCEDRGRGLRVPVGPAYAFKEDAVRARSALLATHAGARVGKYVVFFDANPSEDRVERAELLATLVTRS